jgi:hypothetical protein
MGMPGSAERANALEIETLHANALDVRCLTESLSLLYMNPLYMNPRCDSEAGDGNNQRLEQVLQERTLG